MTDVVNINLYRRMLGGLYFRTILEVTPDGSLVAPFFLTDRNDITLAGAALPEPGAGLSIQGWMSTVLPERFTLGIVRGLAGPEAVRHLELIVDRVERLLLIVLVPADNREADLRAVRQGLEAAGFRIKRRHRSGLLGRGPLLLLATRACAVPDLARLPDTPLVSLVIPVRNEERNMSQCIAGLRKLDYPPGLLEVIFADGRSIDDTATMARAAGFRVVDNPGLNVASGRNAGYAASHGAIVAFTDADCFLPPGWVRNGVRHFGEAAVGGVGGPTRMPADRGVFEQAVNAVFGLTSAIRATVQRRTAAGAREVKDIAGGNAFYRREALASVMPINTLLGTNEDVEMNANLRRNGFRLLMAPDVEVAHYRKSAPGTVFRQMHALARDRATLGRRDRAYLLPRHWLVGIVLPALLLAVVGAGVFHLWFLGLVLAAGLSVGLGFSLVASRRYPVVVAMVVPLTLTLALAGWVSGFIRGFFLPKHRHVEWQGRFPLLHWLPN